MDEDTLRELDQRYLRADDASPLLQAIRQVGDSVRRTQEQLLEFITISTEWQGRMDERLDHMDDRLLRIENFLQMDKTRH